MSDEDTDTALPPPFRSHRHPSISATTRDVPVPSTIVADTSIPVPFTSTTSNIPSTTEATEPSTSQSATSSSSSPTVTAVAASAPSPVLTKPEIAGVTVGSIAAAGFVFGILALFFCLRGRRQKKKRASDASFGNDKIIIDQPRTPSPPSSLAARDIEHGIRGPETSQPYGLHAQAAIGRPPSNRWSFWRSSMKPEDIGIAVAPDPVQQTPYDRSPVTPVSAASYETTSLLLPEKPTYSLYPPPLRLSSHNSHVSPIDAPGTQAVDFARMPPGPIIRPAPAPRGRGTMDTSQTYFHHGQSTLRHVPPDPFVEPASNGRTVLAKQHQTLPAQRPRAAAPAPAVVQHGRLAEPVQVPRKPVPARLPTNDPRVTAQVDNPNDISALYSHPASLTAGPSMSLGAAHPVRRKSSGKRRADGKRPVTFLSTTSDTSFEDAESDDEPPPPLPMSVLAPAVALPRSRPHAAGVRYPVKPTSAAASPSFNQATREVRREQIELNPASDRSKGKAKVNPRTPSPRDKPVPNVPELAGSPLGERQQAPDSSSDRVKPGSAKWSILVAPGLEGIENIGTPRSNASTEWTPKNMKAGAKGTGSAGSKGKGGKITKKFIINASQPASDKIFDVSAFEKFLHDKIKVDNRVGNLGDVVQISQVGEGKIEVVAHTAFSGRYLKYLTKKFLKKQQLRDWLRVVSTSQGVYELRFFNVVNDEADDDDE
ncbi:MAG: hypothetical protein L6R40_005807 [Gallowayella cf. fulva]|nr:MAG: hypothetical protein L6R40_005807 [Xanthomendoza cf. fulva]